VVARSRILVAVAGSVRSIQSAGARRTPKASLQQGGEMAMPGADVRPRIGMVLVFMVFDILDVPLIARLEVQEAAAP
jgi:hypothetical protein